MKTREIDKEEKVKYPTPNVRKRLKEPVVCEICSKILKSKNFLRVHMQRHGEKTHICDSCPKIFGDKSMLRRHVEKTHTQSKCEICLVSVFGLKKHMRLKHRKLTTCSNCGIESKCIWKHEKLCKHRVCPNMWCVVYWKADGKSIACDHGWCLASP